MYHYFDKTGTKEMYLEKRYYKTMQWFVGGCQESAVLCCSKQCLVHFQVATSVLRGQKPSQKTPPPIYDILDPNKAQISPTMNSKCMGFFASSACCKINLAKSIQKRKK